MDKPKREAILDLAKYVNERIRVKFTGGREGQTTLPLHDLCVRGAPRLTCLRVFQ